MEKQLYHGLKLLASCGGGAYGEVYLCEDIAGRKMAVKIVSKRKLGEEWRRELKGVANYRKITGGSADLLRIFHIEEDEESFFYTMEAADSVSRDEYVPDTLGRRLGNGPLPAGSVFGILSAIFSGIKTIHDAGFAHRDIKPDNILFVDGVPKLGDIGLLSSLSASATRIAGTMDFLPPEVRAADGTDSPDQYSRRRNDLYAFGKVIYCAVTGNRPDCWPAVPNGLPLSLPLKLFLRLSFRLCDRDATVRLDSVEAVSRELADIGRQLRYGETLRDKLAYRAKLFFTRLRGELLHAGKFIRRHWLALAVVVLLGAGAAWYFRPAAPVDPAAVKTRIYRKAECGLTMTLPAQWEVMSNRMIRKQIAEAEAERTKDLSPLDKRRLEFLKWQSELGTDIIYCDFDATCKDYITVQMIPLPGKAMMEMPDDQLRIGMRELLQGELGFKTEIYEVKRTTVHGIPCLYSDVSFDPQNIRTNCHTFMFADHCVAISLTAKKSTVRERRQEFAQVIETLKFEKKP